MKTIYKIVATLLILCISAIAVIPLTLYFLDDNEIEEIVVDDDVMEVRPSRTYTILPQALDEKGSLSSNYEFEFSSSNPNILTFESENSGTFTVSSKASVGSECEIDISVQNVSKTIEVKVVESQNYFLDIDLSNNGENISSQDLFFGNEYKLNFTIYPNLVSLLDCQISVLDSEMNIINNLIEITKDSSNYYLKMVGAGTGFIKIQYNGDFFLIPFISSFKEKVLNDALNITNQNYTRNDINSLTTILIDMDISSIDLQELSSFSSLEYITVVNDKVIDFKNYNSSNFDIVVRTHSGSLQIYDLYEKSEIDNKLLSRIYPASPITFNLTVVYYYTNPNTSILEYEVMYYKQDGTEQLLDMPSCFSGQLYETVPNNEYWYYTSNYSEQVEGIDTIQQPRVKLFGKFIGSQFNLSFIVGNEVFKEMTISHNDLITAEDLEELNRNNIEEFYFKNNGYYSRFYDWVNKEGDVVDINREIANISSDTEGSEVSYYARMKREFEVQTLVSEEAYYTEDSKREFIVCYKETFTGLNDVKVSRDNIALEGWYFNNSIKITPDSIFDFDVDYNQTIILEAKWFGAFSYIYEFTAYVLDDISEATLDLSNYTDSNHTHYELLVKDNIQSLNIIGSSNGTYVNTNIVIAERQSDLELTLENVNILNNLDVMTIDATQVKDHYIYLNIIGENNFVSSGRSFGSDKFMVNIPNLFVSGSDAIISFTSTSPYGENGMLVDNLTLTHASMSVIGSSNISYTEGQKNGGIGLKANNEIKMLDGAKLEVRGGDGADGKDYGNITAQAGANDTASGANGSNGESGINGENGGNGGDAIVANSLHIENKSTLIAQAGNGGNGGDGGDKKTFIGIPYGDRGVKGIGGNGGDGGDAGQNGQYKLAITINDYESSSSSIGIPIYVHKTSTVSLTASGGSYGLMGNNGSEGKTQSITGVSGSSGDSFIAIYDLEYPLYCVMM